MWIQSRIPSPSAEAETASSKSRAVAGSTVKVSSAVRSRRSGSTASARVDRVRGGVLDRVLEAALAEALPDHRRGDVGGAFGIADLGDHRGAVAVALGDDQLAAANPDAAADPDLRRRRARTAARRPGSGRGARRPRRTGSSRLRRRRALRRAPRGRGRAPRRRRSVSGSSATRTSGLHALAEDRAAVGGQVLADRQVERAAVGQVDHLLEGALAVGAGADHLAEVVLLQRRGQDLGGRGGAAVDEHHRSAVASSASPVAG